MVVDIIIITLEDDDDDDDVRGPNALRQRQGRQGRQGRRRVQSVGGGGGSAPRPFHHFVLPPGGAELWQFFCFFVF